MIRPLTLEDIPQIVPIHQESLPDSPLVQMGTAFLSEIYYPALIQEAGVFCQGYEFRGELAGFICGTDDADGLSWRMAKANWRKLISNPKWIRSLLSLVSLLLKRSPPPARRIRAALLSFAIRAGFRTAEFYQKNRIKIANELFLTALGEFKKVKISEFKLITDVKNLSNIFYRNMGMKRAGNFKTNTEYCYYIGNVEDLLTRSRVGQSS